MREKHLNDQTWNTIIKRQGKKPTSPIARGMWITSSQWQTWRACWLMPCQPNCVQYNIPNVNAIIIGRYCITIRFLILLVIERVYYVIERFWPISMSRQGPERCREISMHSPSRKPTNGPWLRPQNMKEMLFCCSNNLPYDENDENLCFFVVGGEPMLDLCWCSERHGPPLPRNALDHDLTGPSSQHWTSAKNLRWAIIWW